MPCLSGAEVETWGNLSEVEAFTTRPASPGPAAGGGCASAAGLETFAEAMLETKKNRRATRKEKFTNKKTTSATFRGLCTKRGGSEKEEEGQEYKTGEVGHQRADLDWEIPALFWGAPCRD